ncbi:cell division protein FtsK [Candidatus Magnetomorum sp. HK-1]|nr:cell division protein FtsK [Candidatus Magnetomorum sp. HK-1]
MYKVNVTDLRICQKCPRLFAYHLQGKTGIWRIGLSGSGNFPGRLFHDKIANVFHEQMASKKITPMKNEMLAAVHSCSDDQSLEKSLSEILERYLFVQLMEKQGIHLKSFQIESLLRGFSLWRKHVVQLIKTAIQHIKNEPSMQIWTQIFLPPEKLLSATYGINSNVELKVNGKYDALMVDIEKKEIVITEFKGLNFGNEDDDFLQLVLYCWLIKESTGLSPRGVLFYLEEEQPAVYYQAKEITDAMNHLLAPLFKEAFLILSAYEKKEQLFVERSQNSDLCQKCPFNHSCDTDFHQKNQITERKKIAKKRASKIKSTNSQKAKEHENDEYLANQEAENAMKNVIETFQALKLPVKASGYIAGPRFIRLKITPQVKHGVIPKKIMSHAETLQLQLELQTAPLIKTQAGYVSIDFPRKISIPLTLKDVWEKGQSSRPVSNVTFPIGMSIEGQIFWANLAEPGMTSILVGGTAGSGKSVFLRSVILGLALNASPENVKLVLIDPKRVSFTDLKKLPHLLCPVLMDQKSALEMLSSIVDEMESRYRILEKACCEDITIYNKSHTTCMAHQVVIIDEYADLIIDKKTRENLEQLIIRLAQKGRAAGIHIILATQRPDVKIVTPIIKANLQLKIALKVTTKTNSMIILDQPGAEYLIGRGDMIIGGSVPFQRLQGAFSGKEDINLIFLK